MRRCLSILLSFVILAFDGAAVFGIYLLTGYLQFTKDTSTTTEFALTMVNYIPGIGLTIIGALVDLAFDFCVELEKWDFMSTKITQHLWRKYIAQLFTLGIVYFLIFNFTLLEKTPLEVFGVQDFDFGLNLTCPVTNATLYEGPLSNSTLINYTSYSNCKEDSAAINLFSNLMVDFVMRKITPLIILLIRYIYFRKIKGKKKFKSKYDVIDTSITIVTFDLQMLIMFPIFPYIIGIAPILLFLEFKYEFYNLTVFKDIPEELSLQNKLSHFLVTIYNYSLLGVIGVFVLAYVSYYTRHPFLLCHDLSDSQHVYKYGETNCGPFKSMVATKEVTVKFIENLPV